MAGRIPSEFIQQLLARVDLADLIGRYVPLKKAGAEFKACCPFHNEKTPSFTVSPRKGFYHCFGCGAHGTAITFLMDYNRYSFPDAVEELAKQTGLEVPHVGGSVATRQELDPLYECTETACQFYQKELTRSKSAQAYAHERGLSDQICEEYRIGYAPPGFENLGSKLSARFSKELLLKVGLLSEKENRVYDKFRNRLMFPIRDSRGRVLGFGGRVIDSEDRPKYMNSPETPLFHKGRVLYGVHELQQHRGKVNYLILTEGYMDVVSLAQAGVRNALATLGTATTEDHIRQMGRFCRTFVFCFDGDPAGRAAGWRALENLLPVLREGDEVRFAHLEEGEDPDSYIRAHGTSGWKEFIREAVPLEDYFFTHLEQGLNLDSASGKSVLVAKARPLLEKVGAPVFRDLMIRKLCDTTGLREDQLRLESAASGRTEVRRLKPTPSGRPTTIRKMIRLLLEYPGLARLVSSPDELRAIPEPGFRLFAAVVELAKKNPEITPPGIIESFHGQDAEKHLSSLMSWRPIELSGVQEEEEAHETFMEGMRRFREKLVKQQISRLHIRQVEQGALNDAEQEKLASLRKELKQLLGKT
ncbi:MAG: DNA primase [Gammaproteobacteria bacterium]|nr:DNA primase [Gammaproteobacteria bacterium]